MRTLPRYLQRDGPGPSAAWAGAGVPRSEQVAAAVDVEAGAVAGTLYDEDVAFPGEGRAIAGEAGGSRAPCCGASTQARVAPNRWASTPTESKIHSRDVMGHLGQASNGLLRHDRRATML